MGASARDHVARYDRARTLETLCYVWEANRDSSIAKAIEYARAASDTHDVGQLSRARWHREQAEMFSERLEKDRAELERLRGLAR